MMAGITALLFAHQFIVSGLLLVGDLLATIAVAYGIVLETPEEPTARERRAVKFVIIGVVFEAVFSIGLFTFDEAVMSAQGADIQTLAETAGKAKAIADAALNDAKTATDKINLLHTEIIADEKAVSDLEAAIRRANTELAKFRPRELSADQIAKLRAAIAAVPKSVPHEVVLSYLSGDQESSYFTYEIGRYFAVASWKFDPEVRTYPYVPLVWGVKIWGPDNSTTRAVKRAFTQAKIPFSTDEIPGGFQSFGHMPMPSDTTIFVGPKQPDISSAEAKRAGVK